MPSPKADIQTRADIERFVRKFYDLLLADETLSYIFTDVAKIDLQSHLIRISDFWEGILLNPPAYRRNAMQPHLQLNKKTPLLPKHFERLLTNVETSIDAFFAGDKAHHAKNRARSIAMVMQVKLAQMEHG